MECGQDHRVEPYVMAAEVYANENHRDRGGGWTWYTGSTGWMYQFLVDSLLGLKRKGNRLELSPCFPVEWPSMPIAYRFGKSRYRIILLQSESLSRSWWKSEDRQGDGEAVELVDDSLEHAIEAHFCISSNSARVSEPEFENSLT